MRVVLDVADRPEGPVIVVTAPDRAPQERPVRWTAGHRLLVARDELIGDAEASALADAVDRGGDQAGAGAGLASSGAPGRDPDAPGSEPAARVRRYGRLLFEAAFGADWWQLLVAAAAGQPCLELAVRGGAGQEPGAAALQALRWEALHDGTAHVAAKGTTGAGAGTDAAAGNAPSARARGPLPVGVVRLVPAASGAAGDDPGELAPISHIPRVLFAIGSRLTDPRVRPGAEFMGIMRHLERNGGSIQPRLAESASVASLTAEIARFTPDVLHVIGHGRWFAAPDDCVKLQLRRESGPGDDWVTADQLLDIFAEARHVPTLVVLSACQTASGGAEAGPVNTLPFAARLVAGGVPVVVAMAGDISDTACRVFTRALTQAIGEGISLVDAVIRGRRAAFHHRPDRDSTDWMLPALFLAGHLSGDSSLVDTAAIDEVRWRLTSLELAHDPVFCGRREFVAAMDQLLDDADPLNVLVACTPDASNSYGGMRLLQELAARTVRAGHLPVLLGPYDQGQPTDHVRFARNLSSRLAEIRGNLGLPDAQDGLDAVIAEARAYTDLADKPLRLVRAIREAFRELGADLTAAGPGAPGRPRVVLLCHRVDKWADAVRPLLAMLGARGLNPGQEPVPVVLTGTDAGELAEMRLAKSGAAWVRFLPLGRFRSDDDDPEDILAYQWWLLNPNDKQTPVYAPRRGQGGWEEWVRALMRDRPLYARKYLLEFAEIAVRQHFFTFDRDEDILDGYARVAR